MYSHYTDSVNSLWLFFAPLYRGLIWSCFMMGVTLYVYVIRYIQSLHKLVTHWVYHASKSCSSQQDRPNTRQQRQHNGPPSESERNKERSTAPESPLSSSPRNPRSRSNSSGSFSSNVSMQTEASSRAVTRSTSSRDEYVLIDLSLPTFVSSARLDSDPTGFLAPTLP